MALYIITHEFPQYLGSWAVLHAADVPKFIPKFFLHTDSHSDVFVRHTISVTLGYTYV